MYVEFSRAAFIAVTFILSYDIDNGINPLTPELIPSAQRCLTRFFTWDFVS
jgi:hypothetical protein